MASQKFCNFLKAKSVLRLFVAVEAKQLRLLRVRTMLCQAFVERLAAKLRLGQIIRQFRDELRLDPAGKIGVLFALGHRISIAVQLADGRVDTLGMLRSMRAAGCEHGLYTGARSPVISFFQNMAPTY